MGYNWHGMSILRYSCGPSTKRPAIDGIIKEILQLSVEPVLLWFQNIGHGKCQKDHVTRAQSFPTPLIHWNLSSLIP